MRLQHPPRTMTNEDLAEVRANFLARLNDGPLDQLPMGCRSDSEWQPGVVAEAEATLRDLPK